jgi:hypothetical protein
MGGAGKTGPQGWKKKPILPKLLLTLFLAIFTIPHRQKYLPPA